MTPPEGISDADQAKSDEQRLAELGYKQELSRTWSAFTNFAISFTIISVLAGMLHGVRLRLAERRPGRGLDRLAGALSAVFCVAFSMAELTSAYPDRRRALLVGPRPRRQGLELDDRLVQHRRPARDRRLGRLRRGDLPQHPARPLRRSTSSGSTSGTPTHILGEQFLLFLIILLALHGGEHLRRPLPGADEQHLGGLAPARCRGGHRTPLDRARTTTRARFRLHPEVQRVRLLRRVDQQLRLLVLRPADRLPADDVHGDGLRRLRPHRRGDPGRRDRRRAGRLALRVLLGHHRLDPAAVVPVRGDERECDRRRRGVLDVHLHLGARFVGGEARDPDRDRRPAVLRRRRPDQRLTDLVRVLARPGDPGLEPVPPGEPRPGAVQRGHRRSRSSRW